MRLTQEPDGFFSPAPGISLYRSAFNIAWFAEFGIEPRVIFDIGSYDGGDGVRFMQAFPASRVVSFEADPDRFKIVQQSAQFGVELVQCAVSDVDGQSNWFRAKDHLHAGGGYGAQGSLYLQNEALNKKFSFVEQAKDPIIVTTTRLDTFCRGHGIRVIDLAHIDVQGAEYDVIMGLGTLRPKLLYVEVEQGDGAGWIGAKDTEWVHRLHLELGYTLAGDFVTDRLYVHADVGRP